MNFSSILGPTRIHAPRPRPLTTSVGIGTSDFGAATSDAETQGVPSAFELSSFLQDSSLAAASFPLSRAPVSVLSLNLRQVLDAGPSAGSPPPARVTVCQATSMRDEVQYVDVATYTGCVFADKAVLAVAVCCDDGTVHEAAPVVPLPADSDSESPHLDVAPPGLRFADSPGSTVVLPEDFGCAFSV